MTTLFDRRALGAATLSAIAMLVVFVAAFAWLENRVATLLDAEVTHALNQDLLLYRAVQREAGTETMTGAIRRRLDYLTDGRMMLLLDAQGRPVLGDPRAWPTDVTAAGARWHVPLPDGANLHVVAGDVGDGHRLVIGQHDSGRYEVADSLVKAGVAAMLVVLAAGVLVGVRFNGHVLARLAGIAEAAQKIMRGQMQARAPEPQRLDALGSLARVFNEMLDQNEALVTGMRTATESLAHDLRTPLMRLQRSISAARDVTDPAQREEFLAIAEAEAEHTLRTFSSLIDLARAEAGLSRDAMERTDLAALATDVADLFEPLAEERLQHLERDIHPATGVAHRQILFQALGNLLENAIKYSPAGSRLRLRLEPATAQRGPAFVVEDSGPGIPVHAREQVLRPFVRLESAGRKPGSGLGLAIASAAARLHGGQLALEDATPGLRVRLQLGVERRGDGIPDAVPELRTGRPGVPRGARSAAEA
jgi:signal transduction histidine kinase